MGSPTLFSNHGLALLCIARDPASRLRDIAQCLDVTERTAHRLVTELDQAGYLIKRRDGARNRYTLNPATPVRDPRMGHLRVQDLVQLTTGDAKNGHGPLDRRSRDRRSAP